MSKIRITVEREGGYQIGGSISGVVEWSYVESKKNRPVQLNLIYYTEGRGTQDVVLVDSLELSPEIQRSDFSFPLLGYPPSFSGELISLRWAVEAILPYPKDSYRHDFVVSKTGEVIELPQVKQDEKKKKFWHRFYKRRKS